MELNKDSQLVYRRHKYVQSRPASGQELLSLPSYFHGMARFFVTTETSVNSLPVRISGIGALKKCGWVPEYNLKFAWCLVKNIGIVAGLDIQPPIAGRKLRRLRCTWKALNPIAPEQAWIIIRDKHGFPYDTYRTHYNSQNWHRVPGVR